MPVAAAAGVPWTFVAERAVVVHLEASSWCEELQQSRLLRPDRDQ